MESRFAKTVYDFGDVSRKELLSGRFDILSGEIKKCKGPCSCGGYPSIGTVKDERGFSFSVLSKIVGGRRDVTMTVMVEFTDGIRQAVWIKYRIR